MEYLWLAECGIILFDLLCFLSRKTFNNPLRFGKTGDSHAQTVSKSTEKSKENSECLSNVNTSSSNSAAFCVLHTVSFYFLILSCTYPVDNMRKVLPDFVFGVYVT